MGQLLRNGDPVLHWADVVFEILVLHVHSSFVMMVQGTPKTEPSAKMPRHSFRRISLQNEAH
jgi:hypothetical protein